MTDADIFAQIRTCRPQLEALDALLQPLGLFALLAPHRLTKGGWSIGIISDPLTAAAMCCEALAAPTPRTAVVDYRGKKSFAVPSGNISGSSLGLAIDRCLAKVTYAPEEPEEPEEPE